MNDKDFLKLIEKGLALENIRRNPPLTDKGLPKNFEENNKIYQEFLSKYGYLILNESKNILESFKNETSRKN